MVIGSEFTRGARPRHYPRRTQPRDLNTTVSRDFFRALKQSLSIDLQSAISSPSVQVKRHACLFKIKWRSGRKGANQSYSGQPAAPSVPTKERRVIDSAK